MDLDIYNDKVNRITAKAWADDEFRAGLLADPVQALASMGLAVPAGMQVEVLENSDTKLYLALPKKPEDGALSEEILDSIVGGGENSCCYPCCN